MPELQPGRCTTNACAEDPKPATHRLVFRGNTVMAEPASTLQGATLCDACAAYWNAHRPVKEALDA